MSKDSLALAAPTDADLFSETRSGDDVAFASLIERHKDALVNYLTRIAGSREQAEDVAQEAFIRLCERSAAYEERGQLKSYLYRTATNLLISRQRRRTRWRGVAQQLAAVPTHEPALQGHRLLRSELAERLIQALSEVSVKYRIPIVLRDVEDWSYSEIAKMVNVSVGTVKSRIHRGRQQLRRLLQSDNPEDRNSP